MADTAGISFTGLASGLDTKAIISAIVKVDQTRIDGLTTQQTAVKDQISAAGTLRSKMAALTTSLNALRFQRQILAQSATTDTVSGQPTIVSAAADSTATPGAFLVNVDQIATATKRLGTTGTGRADFDSAASFQSSGLSLTPTAGSFTINGISINATAATKVDDFVSAINAAQAQTHVIASYVTNGGGNPVGIKFDNDGSQPVGTAIRVGSAGDTSNFLTAAKLSTAAQAGETLQSTDTLGRVIGSANLGAARLSTPLSQATGSFTINGVSFNYDANIDSLGAKIAEINQSTANVTAAYDSVLNRLILTSKGTGAQSVSVADTAGNFLAATGLTNGAGATESLGLNALYRVDTVAGGAQQSSTSNTISGIIPGVTLTLAKQSATAVTVTVAQDTTKPLASAKEFITAFNDASEYIRTNTRPGTDGKPGVFQDNLGIRLMSDRMRSIATGMVSGLAGSYKSLSDLGISTGAIGSQVGTTNNLTIDETKFSQALQANPTAAFNLMNSLTPGSTGVFENMRQLSSSVTLPGGTIYAATDSANARLSSISRQITANSDRLTARRKALEAQFARMESSLATIQAQGQRLQSQLSQSNK